MKKAIYIFLTIISIHTSGQYANGKIKIYFNRPVDNALATNYPAVFLNETMSDTLAAYIDRAKYTIDVAQYDYLSYASVANIATAINSAYSRGVVVRWIYNGSSPNSALTSLNSGIKTLASPTTSSYGIMHNKFVIIDANSSNVNDPIVWTGSADWSQEQIDSDVNNIIIFQDQPLAQAYTAQFNQMWGGTGASPVTANEKFGPNKTDLGQHTFTIGGSTVELYFSPVDGTNTHILDAINSANSQLFFGVYTFTESNDANAIVARKNAGVVTAGIIDQYSNGYSAATILNSGLGAMVETYTQSTSIYHSKYLIADACDITSDPLVLTGSHNWTSSADTKNDENTVIIHNADVANIYYQSFYQNFTSMGGTLTPCTASNPCANAITATVTVNTNVQCYGQSNGSATVNAHGQHGPFTYTWSSSPAQTDSVLSNVASGSYTVTILDAGSCSATASVTISQPAALNVSVSETNISCSSTNDGSATVSVTGATNPSYSWSNGSSTATITGLIAATYTVTVLNSNSCSATGSATISATSGITSFSITADKTSLCYGDSANLCAVSGFTTYQWSNSASGYCIYVYQTGNYSVTASSAGGCSATAAAIAITVHAANPATFTSAGSMLTASAGQSYQWLLNGNPINGAINGTWTAAQSGNYSVEVTDYNGCTTTSPQSFITVSGIENVSNNDFVNVYPNPLSGSNWQLEVSSDWVGSNIDIFDVSGKLAFKSEVRNLKSELSINLAPGIYLMKLTSNDRSVVRKLIKL